VFLLQVSKKNVFTPQLMLWWKIEKNCQQKMAHRNQTKDHIFVVGFPYHQTTARL